MAKCRSGGKFLASNDSVHCCECSAYFHRACVSIPVSSNVDSSWQCPGCEKKTLLMHNSTPIRHVAAPWQPAPLPNPTPSILDDTALNKTELAFEIRSFRNELNEMRSELRELRKELAEFRSFQTEYNMKMTTMENKISALENKFEEKVPTNSDALEDIITELRCEQNERDQQLLSNDVVSRKRRTKASCTSLMLSP